MDDTLQLRIKTLQEEVLALKTAKKAGLLLKSQVYTIPQFNFATGLYKITYEDGEQPIITRDYSQLKSTFFTPEGNEQYMYNSGSGMIAGLSLQSTRKILDIEWLHA